MNKIILGLLFLVSTATFANNINGKFTVKYIDEDLNLTSSDLNEREQMIELTNGKGNYKYALRAAVVSTSELKQDSVLVKSLDELAKERKIHLHKLQVTVERTKDNDAVCRIDIDFKRNIDSTKASTMWRRGNISCYHINGHTIASDIQRDLDGFRLSHTDKDEMREALGNID